MLISKSQLKAWANALVLEPSSGRRDTDRGAETSPASGFFMLFFLLVWPLDTMANETMICLFFFLFASIAKESKHDCEGYLEKNRKHASSPWNSCSCEISRLSGKQLVPVPEENQTARVEETVLKMIKLGSTDSGMILWVWLSLGTGCSSLFVHTDPVKAHRENEAVV